MSPTRDRRDQPTLRENLLALDAKFGVLRWLPAVVGLFGAILLAVAGSMLSSHLTMLREWPEITGRVVEATIDVNRPTSSSKRGNRYGVMATLQYEVNGTGYQSSALDGTSSEQRSIADARLAEFTPGSVHRIWYDPGNPNTIRLDLDDLSSVFYFVALVAFLALMVFVAAWILWRWRAQSLALRTT